MQGEGEASASGLFILSILTPHPEVCCCYACSTVHSTSDTDTPDAPGAEFADKPVYTAAQVIYALRTSDGSYGTIAWAGNDVSYSIGTGGVAPGHPNYRSEYAGFVEMSQTMHEVAREAFELWDEGIAINLNEVQDDPGASVTFNYSSNTGGGTYASYYYGGSSGGRANFGLQNSTLWFADDWWTHDQDSDLVPGGYGVMTYLHEIGHALGLSHPGGYNGSGDFSGDATHFQDTRGYTVMSYFNANENGSGTDHRHSGNKYGATPLLHDILAAQAVYGADMTTRTESTTYGFNSNAGRDAFDFSINSNPVIAIWDAGGVDKIDASGWSTDQVLDLNDGAFSSLGNLTQNVAIAYGATIEIGTTGGGNDQLIGNTADNVLTGGGGNDSLFGGDGADILFGGAGGDTIDGGAGIDWLRFADANGGVAMDLETGTGSGGDAAGDVISGIEHVSGSDHGDTIVGNNVGDNQLLGLGGDDVLTGGSGHDFLLGHGGDDSLFGGNGRDILRGGEGADYLDGGVSIDWVQYNDALAGVSLDLMNGGTGGEALGDQFVGVENVLGSGHDDVITGTYMRNLIMAGAGNDTIDGGDGADVLSGSDGDDQLFGSDGSDVLFGGAGADSLNGGSGFDWAHYGESTAGVSVDLGAGTGSGGDAAGDTLTDIEFLCGSEHDDVLTGSSGVNLIRGAGGNDTINSGEGNDVLDGQAGVDRFEFAAGHGIDRIHGFDLATEQIRFLDTVNSFAELSITDFRGEAAIGYDPGDVIILTGITAAEVTADIFLFG